MRPRPGPVEIHELLEHAGWARALARSLIRDPSSADDALQDTWEAALASPPGDRRNLRGWLARTLGNAARQRARSEQRRADREQTREPREPVPTPAELAERLELQRILAEEVAALPEALRSTLLLRFYEGRTPREIAADSREPAGTVRWRLHEALAQLRERLDRRHGDRATWLGAFSPLAGREAVPGVGAGAVIAGVLLMNVWTKVAVAAVLVALFAGVVVWRTRTDPFSTAEQVVKAPAALDSAGGDRRDFAGGGQDATSRADLTLGADEKPSLTGTVVDLAYPDLGLLRKPAVGAVVRLRLDNSVGVAQDLEARTNARGEFEFQLPATQSAPKSYWVHVLDDADYRGAQARGSLAPGAPLPEVGLERPAHGVLEGKTVDEHGVALAGVAIRVTPASGAAEELVSDTNGAFRIERFRGMEWEAKFSATKRGYRIAVRPEISQIPAGGWAPLHIEMLPSGTTIVLHAKAGDGDVMASIRGEVSLARAEASTNRSWAYSGFGRDFGHTFVEADSVGRIEFEDVWRDRKLQFSLSDGRHTWQCERILGSELIPGTSAGEPIVVTCDRLELQVRAPEELRLSGQVVRADGMPVPHATVEVSDVDVPARGAEARGRVRADEQGRFEHRFIPTRLPFRLRLRASDATDEFVVDTPLLDTVPAELHASFREATSQDLTLEPQDLASGRDVRLVLQPTLSIRGRAIDEQGKSCGYRVSAVPCGATSRDRARRSMISEQGVFEIDGLLPGEYDLLVDLERTTRFLDASGGGRETFALAPVRFPDFPAGARDVELRMSPQPTVDVTVEARAGSGKIGCMLVVLGTACSELPTTSTVPAATNESRIHDHAGWPTPMSGGYDDRDESGTKYFLSLVEPGSSFTWPPMAEGRYWFGVRASASKDDPWSFTEGTGWLDFKAGKYHLVFDVVPTGTVRGRVVVGKIDHALCVALADESGRLLRLERNDATVDTIVPTGADGGFLLQDAPIGPCHLRVGHEAELREGRFIAERAIEIGRDPSAVVEIRLP